MKNNDLATKPPKSYQGNRPVALATYDKEGNNIETVKETHFREAFIDNNNIYVIYDNSEVKKIELK